MRRNVIVLINRNHILVGKRNIIFMFIQKYYKIRRIPILYWKIIIIIILYVMVSLQKNRIKLRKAYSSQCKDTILRNIDLHRCSFFQSDNRKMATAQTSKKHNENKFHCHFSTPHKTNFSTTGYV